MKFKLLGIVALLATTGLLGLAQDAKQEPPPIVKAFPPQLSAQMLNAEQEEIVAQSQLEAAQARLENARNKSRLLIYQAADAVELTKAEKDTCRIAKNANGNWIFNCPAKTESPKKPEIKPKE